MAEAAVVLALGKLVTSFGVSSLRTLIEKETALLQDLPYTELRLLFVENVHRADCAMLFSSLSNMNHLYDLIISANDLNEPLDFNAFNPKCTKLTLTFCKNVINPLPSISSSVPNLIFLSIRRGCWAEHIILHAGWFPQLRTLHLVKLGLKSLVIEEGAIISLEVLLLQSLPSLREVPKGLESLASLKKLNITMQHPEFKIEWERDNWKTKLHHVQEIRL